jgi:hypothetical protein
MWIQQYLSSGVAGSVTSIAVLWTVACALMVHWGIPVYRYWLALALGIACVGTLSALKPLVPKNFQVWSTAAILLAGWVGVLWSPIKRRIQRGRH